MFATEKDLVSKIEISTSHFVKAITDWGQKKELNILRELNLGYGIPDLVVAGCSKKRQANSRLKQLKYSDLLVYTVIKKFLNGLDLRTLQAQTRIPPSRLKTILEDLQTEKLVKRDGESYSTVARPFEKDLEVIAIEAKLKNWRRALKQAYRYKWFAVYSYVFLDANHVLPAMENRSLFKTYNVGLASVDLSGKIEIKIKPQRIRPYDDAMLGLVYEHLLFRTKERLPRT